MFKVWNGHHISLCGLMILIAAGPSPATRLGHRDEVPLGDLMCRLQNVDQTDFAGSAQTVDVDCIYQPSKGGVEEVYDGTLSTIGLDDPLKNQSVLAWVVRGRRTQTPNRVYWRRAIRRGQEPRKNQRNRWLAICESPSFFWGLRRAMMHPRERLSSRRCNWS